MEEFAELSRNVPFCPFFGGGNRDKRGQTGTKRDISGQLGQPFQTAPFRVHPLLQSAHQGGCATTRLLRRVLRRVLETAFEKVLRRVLRRCLAVGF